MIILSVMVALTSSVLWATPPSELSPRRDPNRSYVEYMKRAKSLRVPMPVDQPHVTSAIEIARPLMIADLPDVTKWENSVVLRERFNRFRDYRFLIEPSKANFPRRLTWLYPDDGCYARAALAIRNLTRWSAPTPKKIFAFGDLVVRTPNAIGGEVTWWYHVAPIVEVDGIEQVLDPAIEPNSPLPVEDWLRRMSANPERIEVAICEAGTYVPGDDCAQPSDGIESGAEADEIYFLELEWQRLMDLKRNPERELGENPPWLN